MQKKKLGFSLIELMVVIALVAIVLALSLRISTQVLGKNNVVTEAVAIKGMINQAKGFAMMHGVPVLFSYDNNVVQAFADFDRDGTWGDKKKEMVIGTWEGGAAKPVDLDFSRVEFNYSGSIDHWSGYQTNTENFPNHEFMITPLGLIKQPSGSQGASSGAIFLNDKTGFRAAVYVSPLGDMKIAIREVTDTEWSWND